MFSGHGPEFWRFGIGPRQEIIEAALGMAADDAGDDVGEVAVRLNVEELASFDQLSDHRPVLRTAIGAGEERVLAVERDRADGALDRVVIDLDPAIIEEQAQTRPA